MLITHSSQSIGFGVLDVGDILDLASKHGCERLILAEVNGVGDLLSMLREATIPIQPAVDLRMAAKRIALLLPLSHKAYQAMNQWLSESWRPQPSLDCLESMAGIHPELMVVYPLNMAPKKRLRTNEWVGIEAHEQQQASHHPSPDRLLAWKTMLFRDRRDAQHHAVIRAIDNNALLSRLSSADVLDFIRHQWVDASLVQSRFRVAAWQRGESLLNDAVPWDLWMGRGMGGKNVHHYTGSQAKDLALLRMLCQDAVRTRYPQENSDITNRIDKELGVIDAKGFTGYFLTNWDIIRYANKQGYVHVGRGSGANSLVAYLLRITHVDPIALDLYFERFINRHRTSPPDFDIDFSWKDRPRLTQYLFNRHANVALLGATNTFQYRSAVREVSKIHGLPAHETDELVRGQSTDHRSDALLQRILALSKGIQGLPSGLTVHASGILIAQEPLHCYSSTFMPPKGYPTVDFDMHVAEDLGFYKYDILGQRGLSKIADCIDLVSARQGKPPDIDIHDIAKITSDPETLALLAQGGAMGCFYIESPSMRMLMTKLQTKSYLELVAASSVIRPGVSQSGMMATYIERHNNPDNLPDGPLMSIMPETYGVMIYQEDVMRVAHVYAGLSLAEADILRRGMSGKLRGKKVFQTIKQQFFDNCHAKGYPVATYQDVWRQIESFAGYAFAKGHSASYAVESFQCLYLKAHHPIAFMVATVNNGGGYYRAESYLHEARRHGATILAPCVNHGRGEVTLVDEKTLMIGMRMIHGLADSSWSCLLANRREQGKFASLDDFMMRLPTLPLDQVLLLIRADAFRFCHREKQHLLWAAHRMHNPKPSGSLRLFPLETPKFSLPELPQTSVERAYDQLELLGFVLGDPFQVFHGWQSVNALAASHWLDHAGERIHAVGYLIAVKDSKTKHGEWMQFGTFQDIHGDIFDTVNFPQVTKAHRLRQQAVYVLSGKLSESHGYVSLITASLRACSMRLDPRKSAENAINPGKRTISL